MSNITIVAVAAAVIVVLVSVIAVAVMHRKQRRIMDSIEEMLETARKGSFKEQDFDESRFSALENRFADYLLTSEISAERVKNEKEKIKTLISDISHQTKTPIANIQLYSELLDEMELPQSAKEYTFQLHTDDIKIIFPHYFQQETNHNSSVRFHSLFPMRCDASCSADGRNTENTEPFPFAELTLI